MNPESISQSVVANPKGRPVQSTRSTSLRNVVEPRVDVLENPESLLLVVDVPGANRDGLSVAIDANVLTLTAERKHHPEAPFERSFRLPESIDQSKVSVSLAHGVARVVLPKQEKAKPRRIPVT